MDQRDKKLADLLVNYSCELKAGENILIEYEGAECRPLIKEIIRDVYAAGGKPFVNISDSEINREIILGCETDQVQFMNDCMLMQIQGMDAYISVRGGANVSELADVPADRLNLYSRLRRPALDYGWTRPSGAFSATPTPPWPSWQIPVRRPSRTSTIMSAP